MKVYRMKHIPTGLYYRPSSDVLVKLKNGSQGHVKTNLSKKGKLYARKPTFKYIGRNYYNHEATRQHLESIGATSVWNHRNKVFPFIADEWQIEEVTA